jgi:RNA polymerase sigma-70 factor, ECF subfamily
LINHALGVKLLTISSVYLKWNVTKKLLRVTGTSKMTNLTQINFHFMQIIMAIRDDLIEALPSLRAFARSRVHSGADADDFVQETIAKILAHESKIELGTKILPYGITVLKRLIIDGYRSAKPIAPMDEIDDFPSDAETPEGRAGAKEILKLVQSLPEMCREVLPMLGIGHTYEEISEALGIERNTVGTRLLRCRKQLVTLMEGAK